MKNLYTFIFDTTYHSDEIWIMQHLSESLEGAWKMAKDKYYEDNKEMDPEYNDLMDLSKQELDIITIYNLETMTQVDYYLDNELDQDAQLIKKKLI